MMLVAVVAFVIGIGLLMLAHSDVLISTQPGHINEQKSLFRSLLHEAGFACLVAVLIWLVWEIFHQMETEDQWNARIERIAKSVFFGVFKRNLPDQLIQEANFLLLEQKFVRTGYNATFNLIDDQFERANGQLEPFVRFDAIVRYKVKNISAEPEDCPIVVGIPAPGYAAMKKKCCVRSVQLAQAGGQFQNLNLEEAEKKFREKLDDPSNEQALFTLPSVEVPPGGEIELIWDYATAKAEEDAAVLQTQFPTESITITVVDQRPAHRIVRARSIHRLPFTKISSDDKSGTYIFKLDRYFLPHQAFHIWWQLRDEHPVSSPQDSKAS